MRPDWFTNTEVHRYVHDGRIYRVSSAEAVEILKDSRIEGIDHIGFDDTRRNAYIIIDLYHLERINLTPNGASYEAPQNHMPGWKEIHSGPSAGVMICQHTILVIEPGMDLLKPLYENSNKTVRAALRKYMVSVDYLTKYEDRTWLMATVLGANE